MSDEDDLLEQWHAWVRRRAHKLSVRVACGALAGPEVEEAVLDLVERSAERFARRVTFTALRRIADDDEATA